MHREEDDLKNTCTHIHVYVRLSVCINGHTHMCVCVVERVCCILMEGEPACIGKRLF